MKILHSIGGDKVRVKWENWKGEKFEGKVIEVDSNVLHVKLNNGTMKAVEDSGVTIVNE